MEQFNKAEELYNKTGNSQQTKKLNPLIRKLEIIESENLQ